jgi:hypothetical protein
MSNIRFPIEVWIVISQDGKYVVAGDEETASELAEGEWGDDIECRYVRLETKLAPPNDETVSFQAFTLDIEPISDCGGAKS